MNITTFESPLPPCDEIKNPLRRRQCKENFMLHCLTYHADIFFDPVDFHREMCADLQALILSPGHKRMARAAPRGSGKTTLAVLATEWAICHGHKRCIVWFCINEAKATERANMLQGQLLINGLLADDFPEICGPLKVEGQTDWVSNGKRLSNGAWTLWRSIDGGNLGTLLDFMRPDFILLDDVEDVSTIRKTGANTQSVTAQKRFDRIDKEICFLPERGKGSILLVTTIRSRGCLSDGYTDPETKAAWGGKVYSAIDFGTDEFLASDAGKLRDTHWNRFLALCGSKDAGKEPVDSELMDGVPAAQQLGIPLSKFDAFETKEKRAIRYFAKHEKQMRENITELDPVRIPIWDFYWQVGSDSRGKEIVWSELQNKPLDDPFTKQMRFTEKKLWTHQNNLPIGEIKSGHKLIFCAVVVGTDFIHYEVKSCSDDCSQKHLVECGTIIPDFRIDKSESIRVALDSLRTKWTGLHPKHVAVDIGTESGRDKGEWSESVAKYCALNRPWIALQKCWQWDENQSSRAGFKNWCVEQTSNPYGIVRWNATHFKNRLAAAYNNPEHPITFFDPKDDADILWKYIRSQTSEQYTREFKPDYDASKAYVEKWSPVPKYRDMTEFWKTASMIECLADIYISCKPREVNRNPVKQKRVIQKLGRF